MKHKAKARRATGPKAAPDGNIQDFMLKLSAGLSGPDPRKSHDDACWSVEMGACWVTSQETIDGVTVTVGLAGGVRDANEDTMLICVRGRSGCRHIHLPSRAVALAIAERLARVMRIADRER